MYQKATQLAPTSGAAWVALGDWYSLEANWAAAVEQYQRATDVAPDEILGYLRLGGALQSMGRAGDAWSKIQEALRLEPASGEALVALGDWNRLNVDLPSARATLQQALSDAPGDVKESTRTGLDFLAEGDTQDAYANFEDAIQADPASVVPYVAMGETYRLSAQLTGAERAYRATLDTTPGELDGYLELAKLYMEEGRLPEAGAVLQRAVGLFQASTAYIALGDARRTFGEWPAAEAAYRRAIELEPGDIVGYLRLADFYRMRGRPSTSLSVLEQGVQAGLSEAAAVCGPGVLPDDVGEGADANTGPSRLSWRCQWQRRPWADQFGLDKANPPVG
jgi:tetratricopeptide (TPR) repeat protein